MSEPVSLNELRTRRDGGLTCPRCGCQHFLTPRSWTIIGAVRRRRTCRNCGWTTTSVEMLDPGAGTTQEGAPPAAAPKRAKRRANP